jgi:hypothetical protein
MTAIGADGVWYISAMLKRLAILAISAFLTTSVSCQPSKDARPDNEPTKQEQPAVHPADGVQRQSDAESNQAKAGNNPPTGDASIERPQWWVKSEWWLVIIAGLTGGVICWQSWETRKAANGAREAAQVALLGIRADIDKERPWIVVKTQYVDETFIFEAVNIGNTPASLIQVSTDSRVIQNMTELPRVPTYFGVEFDAPHLLPTGETYTVHLFSIDKWELYGNQGSADEISSGESLYVVFGRVVYADLISSTLGKPKRHETRWACWYNAPGIPLFIRTSFPDGYNQYT